MYFESVHVGVCDFHKSRILTGRLGVESELETEWCDLVSNLIQSQHRHVDVVLSKRFQFAHQAQTGVNPHRDQPSVGIGILHVVVPQLEIHMQVLIHIILGLNGKKFQSGKGWICWDILETETVVACNFCILIGSC